MAVGVCYPSCYDNIDNHMINCNIDSNAHSLQISDISFAL